MVRWKAQSASVKTKTTGKPSSDLFKLLTKLRGDYGFQGFQFGCLSLHLIVLFTALLSQVQNPVAVWSSFLSASWQYACHLVPWKQTSVANLVSSHDSYILVFPRSVPSFTPHNSIPSARWLLLPVTCSFQTWVFVGFMFFIQLFIPLCPGKKKTERRKIFKVEIFLVND